MTSESDAIDWQAVLGPLAGDFDAGELQALGKATKNYPRRAIRLPPQTTVDQLPFEIQQVPWYSAGYYVVPATVRPGGFLQYVAGDYYIQDAGSMLALALSEIAAGQMVCDCCASPGGKSTGALELLDGSGLLVSNEVIASRLQILNLALCRSGYANHITTNQDVERLAQQLGHRFDCVIVDAPCTGQSMIVRGKQSAAAYSQAQISHSSARQLRIVRAAAELVKPGGRLVYSTCTFSFAENEEIVTQLLSQQAGWELRRFPHFSRWESPGFPGCYRLWPHRDDCAGAFAAAMVRSEGESEVAQGNAQQPRPGLVWSPRRDFAQQATDWLDASNSMQDHWFQRGRQIHYFDDAGMADLHSLAVSGVPIAEESSGRVQPLYGSSVLSNTGIFPRRSIELEDSQARQFAAGEAIRLAGSQPGGWTNVTWRGRKLAWGKLTGSLLKNHFPKPLRQQNLS